VASHQLIEDYLAGLARRLPTDTVDELSDGLAETWQHHLAAGLASTDAARAAIAEFGPLGDIADAFVRHAPGRRAALLLLASGPVVGASWGISLITARAWTWPIPTAAAVAFGSVLLVVVAALTSAATSRHSYRRTRLGAIGGLGLIVLDAAMLTAVALFTPALVWPMAAAIPASLIRIGLTARSLPKALVL
jgi:hypothetical protein